MRKVVSILLLGYASVASSEVQVIDEEQSAKPLNQIIKPSKGQSENTLDGAFQKRPTVWTLNEGQLIGKELQRWAATANWRVIWNLNKDWTIPATATFTGDFKAAAAEVIKTLADNGALIRTTFKDGNRVMLVYGPGVAAQ